LPGRATTLEEHPVATRQQTPARGATFADRYVEVVANVEQVIQGKPEVVELALLCLLSEGHLLIEDVPGVGKTSLAKALAASIDGTFGRLQFTPDLLPTDVVGLTVWNRNTSEFEFRPGPVFNNIVLADEINRASPKTQSALLESMAEAQVTVDGTTYHLSDPFMVIATQNPIEHEGTYPLPESQLDRFLMRVSVGYPSPESELEILDTHGDHDALVDIGAVITAEEIVHMAAAARGVHVAPALKSYLVDLANASRRHPHLALGMSPRATLALQRVARARAAAQARSYVVPDDLKALAEPVLAHRLLVTPEAQLQGITAGDALDEVLRAVPVPAGKPR
jgi:MoxR-like ATPase